jgi:carbamoyl-phosphate synthase small subunit
MSSTPPLLRFVSTLSKFRVRSPAALAITGDHGFAVRLDKPPPDVEATHINLNDQTLEGMRQKRWPLFRVQYHPEASAGPLDSGYLFEEFRQLMG